MNMKVIIIDNYDSFTYNLVHIVEEIIDGKVRVVRNDEFDLKELEEYDYIILSPGPGVPDEAGLLKDVIKTYGSTKKIFGVCLGFQAIGEVYGAKLRNLDKVQHGQRTIMYQTGIKSPIFEDVPEDFFAGRYHSWVIDKSSDTSALEVTSIGEYGEIMAAQHKEYQVHGVQFHPESIMTDEGKLMITNFLNI
ncbi:MAG: anthranilate synthase component 2 [Saprospiraceae bacterium]|jgi:anthranilate synthase component 2